MEEPKTPEVLLKQIEQIECELKKYVNEKLIKYGKNKVLVTIPRKGHVLIDHLEQDSVIRTRLKETFTSRVTAEEFFDRTDLHDKDLIIFDDAVDEGRKINDFLQNYERRLGKSKEELKEKIKIGAFIVNDRHYSKLVDEEKLLDENLIGRKEPEEKYRFLKKVLDIITYLIHSGDIIDPDHLLIEGTFTEYIPYKKIWIILKNIDTNIYEPDFGLYHPGKKKITIYNVPYSKWIDVTQLNIINKDFQCKIRFVFDIFQCDQDLYVKKFTIVPVINPIIKNKWSEMCNNFEKKFCKEDYYKDQDLICVDCVLYKLIINVMRGFMKEWYENLKINNINTSDEKVTWNHLDNTYEKSFGPDMLKDKIFN